MITCHTCAREVGKYVNRATEEYVQAMGEVARLSMLFQDICWYNFEYECKKWREPWTQTDPYSPTRLHGMRHRTWYNKGKLHECTDFTEWFYGPICDAPALPAAVVFSELRDAQAYAEEVKARMFDAVNYAPGGPEYRRLAETTAVGRSFSS